ncbi:OmpH family outer membrane protein [Endozoicomonadaceae bacterium StTr2]
MLRSIIAGLVLALGLSSSLAFAEARIGVINSQMAVMESDAARAYAKVAEQRFGDKLKELQNMEKSLKDMEAKLQQEAPTLSQEALNKRELELRRSIEDFQIQSRRYQAEKGQADQEELGRLRPILQQAIDAVASTEKLDLVLEENAVRYVNPDLDITRKVIVKLNEQTKK